MSHGPGTIGIPGAELARYMSFTVSLASTVQPEGTQLCVCTSASVVDNLNSIVGDMRPEDEWLWLIGDDHCWDPEALERLLDAREECGADILVPLVCRRNPPWDLVLFKREVGADGRGLPQFEPYRYDEIPESGTFPIAAGGTAGMLIGREVLDAIGEPWFGSTDGVVLNEDLAFCQRAREAGGTIMGCADVSIGHLGTYRVWPKRRGTEWGTYTDFNAIGSGHMDLFLAGGPRERARAV